MEGWQNGYCTGLENRRPKGLGGSSPSPSVEIQKSTIIFSMVIRTQVNEVLRCVDFFQLCLR
jgi:hypothetical protein